VNYACVLMLQICDLSEVVNEACALMLQICDLSEVVNEACVLMLQICDLSEVVNEAWALLLQICYLSKVVNDACVPMLPPTLPPLKKNAFPHLFLPFQPIPILIYKKNCIIFVLSPERGKAEEKGRHTRSRVH
jgi:hypothetical protein